MTTSTAVRSMAAKFSTTCACGSQIQSGEPIRYVKGFAATHEACGDPTVALAPRARRGRRRGGFHPPTEVCRHEDFPCCGCDPAGPRDFYRDHDFDERDCVSEEEWREWDR